MIPPKPVRRALAPLYVLVELVVVLVLAVALVPAAIVSPLFGGWRPLRFTWLALVFASRHLAATLAMFGLWIASGFGRRLGTPRFRDAHYRLIGWLIDGIHRSAVSVARVHIRETDDSAEAIAALNERERPLVVLGRHAGEGDTLLVLHELLNRYGRRPRIVMLDRLRLDPLIDTFGSRLPNRFIDPRGGDIEHEIEALASDLGEDEALVIFPEGANFSEDRRRRAIERLEQDGRIEQAERARAMRNLVAPRPGGALAALRARPEADVVLVGHVGFPAGLGELWRLLPREQTVEVRLWLARRDEIPDEFEQGVRWLFERWAELDAWVDRRRPHAGA